MLMVMARCLMSRGLGAKIYVHINSGPECSGGRALPGHFTRTQLIGSLCAPPRFGVSSEVTTTGGARGALLTPDNSAPRATAYFFSYRPKLVVSTRFPVCLLLRVQRRPRRGPRQDFASPGLGCLPSAAEIVSRRRPTASGFKWALRGSARVGPEPARACRQGGAERREDGRRVEQGGK